jgi:hypothetical protein
MIQLHLFIVVSLIFFFLSITAFGGDKKETKTNVNVYVPPLPHYQQQQLAPRPVDDWVAYAQRNPQVKLAVVETMTVSDGQFVREKHMRMTGPVPNAVPAGYREWTDEDGRVYLMVERPASLRGGIPCLKKR